ncbi:MAG: hypothetical protein CVV02_01515 [Firmicutes bacterium HGW-Firmicutes-7]|nr:MAG: hypothetical protein CVV02_01515 [Firmicutes bacterium HGW-Firmicutes-7]
MILYLTSDENIGLFDFLADETGALIKKYNGEFELKRFIIHDARNLNPFRYFIVDLEALNDEEDEIISAIIAFNSLFDSRLIILAEKAHRGLLERIITETNIYNIITATTIDKIKEEMRICISHQGMPGDLVLTNLNKDLDSELVAINTYSFIGENVKVVFIGAMGRTGTTTAAINMAAVLANMGAKVSYTEANNNNHLQAIHDHFFFNIPIENGSFYIDGVNYYFKGNIPMADFNFNIIDLGILTESNIKALDVADIIILCAGTKPYELTYLNTALSLLLENEYMLALPLGSNGEHANIKIDQDKLVYLKCSQGLFDGTINSDAFRKILGNYVYQNKSL